MNKRVLSDPQCALITGGSQGLGLALAHGCARRGIDLLLVALPGSGLEQAAQALRATYGVRCEVLAQDLTAPDGPEAVARWATDLGWPLSCLVNNAGVSYNSRFEDSTLEENEAVILVNNLAPVKLTHLLLPELRKRERAYVLNVASLAAFFPMPFLSIYAPSKSFLLEFSLALRQEMRGTPVSVSVLCPNGLRTRPDCTAKNAQLGVFEGLFCMDAAPVAEIALRQTLSGAAIIVPGSLNRMLAALSRLFPRTIVLSFVSAFWGRAARLKLSTHPTSAKARAASREGQAATGS
jgi:short-subunit dehydrogenase